jgi:hypothetical protein
LLSVNQIEVDINFFLHTKPYIAYASCEWQTNDNKRGSIWTYPITLFFGSIQETQCEWNKNIFGERCLGNWPQEIKTTKIAQNI